MNNSAQVASQDFLKKARIRKRIGILSLLIGGLALIGGLIEHKFTIAGTAPIILGFYALKEAKDLKHKAEGLD